MKRLGAVLFSLCFVLGLAACSHGQVSDYPAAIMVNDAIYLFPDAPMLAEIDESAIIGYTESYTDTFPTKNGETNFNRELNMPIAQVKGGIAVLYEHEWYLCAPEK